MNSDTIAKKEAFKKIGEWINPNYSKYKFEQVDKDKPDLQFCELDEGIEVTHAFSKHYGRYIAFVSNKNNKHLTEFEFKKRATKYKINDCGVYTDKNGIVYATSEYDGLSDFDSFKNDVVIRINSKIKKFSGYKKFKTNSLYIICHFYFNELDINDILLKICKLPFDYLYIQCFDTIYVVNQNKNIIKNIKITD